MSTHIRRNDERSRYEIEVDGTLTGVSDFRVVGDVVVFTHTEIDPGARGRGLGAQLVQHALDDVRASGRRARARCAFVAQYLRDHPEYADLAA